MVHCGIHHTGMIFMANDLISKYFASLDLKCDNDVPVYVQLESRFRMMVKDLENRTLLPVEREFSVRLQVSRGTIRKAIKPLVESGLLIRNRKGTFVNKEEPSDSGKKQDSWENLNPLLFGMDAFPQVLPQKRIRLFLYENLANQIQFWQHVSKEFNQKNPQWNVQVEWMQYGNHIDIETYREKLLNADQDILQLPVSVGFRDGYLENFRRPGIRLQTLFASSEYQHSTICSTWKDLLHHAVPISAGFRRLYLNQKLMDQIGVKPEEGTLADWLGKIAAKLPAVVGLIDRLYCLTIMIGFSMENTPEKNQDYLARVFQLLRQLPFDRENLFSLSSDPYLLACFRMFQQKQIVMVYHTPIIKQLFQFKFPVSNRLILPEDGYATAMNCNLFAINKKTENYEGAEAFLEYLLSPPVQQLIAETYQILPMHRESQKYLAEKFGMDENSFRKFADTGREQPYFTPERFGLVLSLWRLMPQICNGNLPLKETLKEIVSAAGLRPKKGTDHGNA